MSVWKRTTHFLFSCYWNWISRAIKSSIISKSISSDSTDQFFIEKYIFPHSWLIFIKTYKKKRLGNDRGNKLNNYTCKAALRNSKHVAILAMVFCKEKQNDFIHLTLKSAGYTTDKETPFFKNKLITLALNTKRFLLHNLNGYISNYIFV